jgi:hypothetical protein
LIEKKPGMETKREEREKNKKEREEELTIVPILELHHCHALT